MKTRVVDREVVTDGSGNSVWALVLRCGTVWRRTVRKRADGSVKPATNKPKCRCARCSR